MSHPYQFNKGVVLSSSGKQNKIKTNKQTNKIYYLKPPNAISKFSNWEFKLVLSKQIYPI